MPTRRISIAVTPSRVGRQTRRSSLANWIRLAEIIGAAERRFNAVFLPIRFVIVPETLARNPLMSGFDDC